MFHFMGIQFGNCDYKLQQIVTDTDANTMLAQGRQKRHTMCRNKAT